MISARRLSATIAGAAGLALLAGCGQGASEPETRDIAVPDGDYQQRIEAMPEGQRNAVFIRAIRDAGRDCQHVESSARQGTINGSPAWTAQCGNGVSWTIAIGGDGIAQVMNSQELQAIGNSAG